MTQPGTCTQTEERIAFRVLHQISVDLSRLFEPKLEFRDIETECAHTRPVGKYSIHISFRLSFSRGLWLRHGCLLLPLRDAITLAALLLELPEAHAREKRKTGKLDEALKDAMVETGNFLGGSAATALRAMGYADLDVRLAGCQGVRSGVRPAMEYEEGDRLIVSRAHTMLPPFPEFETTLVFPDLNHDKIHSGA